MPIGPSRIYIDVDVDVATSCEYVATSCEYVATSCEYVATYVSM